MNFSRIAAAGIAATALGTALPAVASATDYCVAPNYSCGANNVQKVQVALDLAASTQEADRVLLGEATYSPEPGKGPFSYTKAGAPVEIVGAGRGRTVLTAPDGSLGQVLTLKAGSDSSVRDLTVRIPTQAANSFRGLLTDGAARRIEVVEAEGQIADRYGVLLEENGTLEDSTVTLSTEGDTTGVSVLNPVQDRMISLRGVTIAARTGVRSHGHLTMDRTRVTGGDVGVLVTAMDTTITNSLVRQTWVYGTGIKVRPDLNYSSSVTADGLTVVGANTPDVAGVVATTSFAPARNVEVRLANSVIRGASNPLGAVATGAGAAKISASFADYNRYESITIGAGATIDETHVTNVGDAGFVNEANGDYRLRGGSPLVDLGDPDVPQSLDLEGNPLVADGNGDGFARRDIGAFELQPAAPQPQPQADTQPPVITGFRARRLGVSYKLSERARVTVKVQRRLAGRRARYRTLGKVAKPAKQGANRLKLSRRIRARDARPGRYRAVIVAIDAAGNRSAPKVAAFRVRRR